MLAWLLASVLYQTFPERVGSVFPPLYYAHQFAFLSGTTAHETLSFPSLCLSKQLKRFQSSSATHLRLDHQAGISGVLNFLKVSDGMSRLPASPTNTRPLSLWLEPRPDVLTAIFHVFLKPQVHYQRLLT